MPNVPNLLLRQTACWSFQWSHNLTEEVTTAIRTSYPAVQISLDKFGLSKIVNLVVLSPEALSMLGGFIAERTMHPAELHVYALNLILMRKP